MVLCVLCHLTHSPPPAVPTNPLEWHRALPRARVKAMPTGIQPSPSDDLKTFTARLDGLRTDQSSDDLSNALRAAFKERDLYKIYVSSLGGDPRRAKALLEVFDKVRPARILSHGLVLNTDARHRPFRLLLHTISRSSSSLGDCAARQDFYQPHTSSTKVSSGRPSILSPGAVLATFGKASITTNEWL